MRSQSLPEDVAPSVQGLGEQVVLGREVAVQGAQRHRRIGGDYRRAIKILNPDLVIANKEENRRQTVAVLEEDGIPVFVTYARTVRQAVDEIELLGHIAGVTEAAERIVNSIEACWQKKSQPSNVTSRESATSSPGIPRT